MKIASFSASTPDTVHAQFRPHRPRQRVNREAHLLIPPLRQTNAASGLVLRCVPHHARPLGSCSLVDLLTISGGSYCSWRCSTNASMTTCMGLNIAASIRANALRSATRGEAFVALTKTRRSRVKVNLSIFTAAAPAMASGATQPLRMRRASARSWANYVAGWLLP